MCNKINKEENVYQSQHYPFLTTHIPKGITKYTNARDKTWTYNQSSFNALLYQLSFSSYGSGYPYFYYTPPSFLANEI